MANIEELRTWIAKNDWLVTDGWILVGLNSEIDDAPWFTYSTITDGTKDTPEIVARYQWDAFNQEVRYAPQSDPESMGGIRHRAFAVCRYYDEEEKKPYFELTQDFVWYYDAHFNPNANVYEFADDTRTVRRLAKFETDENESRVYVDAHFLRAYLRDREATLVRFHDFKSYLQDEPTDHCEELKGDTYCFLVTAGDMMGSSSHKSFTRLLGKTVVLPYAGEPTRERGHIEFVIGRDETSGEAVESDGTTFDLKVIQFEMGVLKRYFDEPMRFSVEPDILRCGYMWSLQLWENRQSIGAFLKDVQEMPLEEQKHWRNFSVVPRALSEEERNAKDRMFGIRLVSELNNLRESVNKHTAQRLGSPLFLELDSTDKLSIRGLHVPLTDEQHEFDAQMVLLAKLLVDSLNKDFLGEVCGRKVDPSRRFTTFNAVDQAVTKWFGEGSDAAGLSDALYTIQRLRSSGAAHMREKGWYKELEKRGFEDKPNSHVFELVARQVCFDLNELDYMLRNLHFAPTVTQD